MTDYDVDGTTSCLILHGVLDWRMQESGSKATVSYHLPDRFLEGYGLSLRAVELAALYKSGVVPTALPPPPVNAGQPPSVTDLVAPAAEAEPQPARPPAKQ